MLGHFDYLVIKRFIENVRLNSDQERERSINGTNHLDRQDGNHSVLPAQREYERAKGNRHLCKQRLMLRNEQNLALKSKLGEELNDTCDV